MYEPAAVRRRAFPLILLVGLLGLACARGEPPGAEVTGPRVQTVGSTSAIASAEPVHAPAPDRLGTINDNLPFVPDGKKLASIAWRTWIYSDVGGKRTRYGYLRAGAVVDARGPEIKNDGCPGGWYRINPRGFVCIGMGASLDLAHPVVVASKVRPTRAQSLPYLYALAGGTPPLRYFRLPSPQEMAAAEGEGVDGRAANFRERVRVSNLAALLGPLGAPPEFLSPKKALEKPYGTKSGLHLTAHAGPASPDSGFSIATAFEWQGRVFGLTTELDLIALDRTKLVRPSELHGVEFGLDEGLPAAFVMPRYAQRYRRTESGGFAPDGAFAHREGLKLTGNTAPGGMLEARGDVWAAEATLRIIQPRKSFPSVATGDRKWVDVSIKEQTLVAYSGRRPVYATLISSGRGGMGEPEDQATVRGTFMIYQKDVASTMDGEDDQAADSVELHDVPFVQYFHSGFALHGTYWHDEFGKIRSHGCVNLAPADAAWIFEWTDPPVPADWHGVINKERGTVVYVRP